MKSINLPYLDLRAIIFFRIILGGVIVFDLIVNKWPFITYFYTDSSIVPFTYIDALGQYYTGYKVLGYNLMRFFKTELTVHYYFVVLSFFLVLYALGFRAKFFGLLSLLLLISLQMRNHYVVSGPDYIMSTMLFWSLLLPIDNPLSSIKNSSVNFRVRTLSSFGVIFQISIIYFFNAVTKNGDLWQNGDAVSYALLEDLWVNSKTASLLLKYPLLCSFLTKATIIAEYCVPILILFPIKNEFSRLLSSIFIVFLHLGFFVVFKLGVFPLVAIMLSILLLPSTFLDKILPFQKSVQLNNYTFKDSLTNRVLSSLLLILVGFNSIFLTNKLKQSSFNSSLVVRAMDNIPFLKQPWGMYAPNPTRNPSYFRVVAYTQKGKYIDVDTKKEFSNQSKDIYKQYTWSVFYYMTNVYGDVFSSDRIRRWAELKKEKWNKENPDNIALQIYIYSYTKSIDLINQHFPIESKLIYKL